MTAVHVQRQTRPGVANTFRPYRGLNVNVFSERVHRVQEAEREALSRGAGRASMTDERGGETSATDRGSHAHASAFQTRRIKGTRKTHFRAAMLALPTPAEGPDAHQRLIWSLIQARLIRDGWKSVSVAAKRHGWWYAEYVRLLAVMWTQEHVESCPSCTESTFEWVLSSASHVPDGAVFSLEGMTE